MEANTSSEFLEWMIVLDKIEWLEKSKQDYYLAQIAAEVRIFREAFSNKPKPVNIDDCFLKFKEEEKPVVKLKKKVRSHPTRIVPGPEAVKDPEWAEVNRKAKAVWAARLGLPSLE